LIGSLLDKTLDWVPPGYVGNKPTMPRTILSAKTITVIENRVLVVGRFINNDNP